MAADNEAWIVGQRHWNGAAVYGVDGLKVVTGTMEIQYVLAATIPEYLQSDLTTVSTTPATISIPYVAAVDAHAHLLTIPESLRGRTGEIIVTDPTSGEEYRESFTVAQTSTTSGGSGIIIVPD